MPEIAGAVESLEIYREPNQGLWDFHIHWKTNNGDLGCTIKTLAPSHVMSSPSTTLARIGLSEQALTGNPIDALDPRIEIALQRPDLPLDKLMSTDWAPTAVMRLHPHGRGLIPIPIRDELAPHGGMTIGDFRFVDPDAAPDDPWSLG